MNNNKQSIAERLVGTLQRIRIPLLVGTILFILILVGMLVYVEISSTRREEAIRMVEEIQEQFDEWETSLDQDAELLVEIRQKLREIIKDYPNEYGASRALFLLGKISWEEEEYEDVVTLHQQLATDFPNSHLAPIALYYVASAQQDLDQLDEALTTLVRLTSEYPNSIVTPQALFSLGRMAEAKDEYESALERYQTIIDDYTSSQWSNLAHTRKIELFVSEKVEREQAVEEQEN